jgi:hypothetical protein
MTLKAWVRDIDETSPLCALVANGSRGCLEPLGAEAVGIGVTACIRHPQFLLRRIHGRLAAR